MIEITVQALVQRYATGTEGAQEAFGELYSRHSADLLQFLKRYANSCDPHDTAQLAWLAVHRHRARYEIHPPEHFRAYLWTIARRIALKAREARALDILPLEGIEPFDKPAQRNTLDTLPPGIARALNALSPTNKRLVRLLYCEGLSRIDAALQLAMPLGTLKSRLTKIKESLLAEAN